MEVATIGSDISKHVFHIHAVDGQGQVAGRQRLRRGEIVSFFSSLAPCLVGIEACATAHHWAREIRQFGHDVRLIPPAYVKPYVRRGAKNDAADAAAICEAVTRPNMQFVPIKSVENQGFLMLHRARCLLVRQRTMTACAIRAHFAEFGIIVGQGRQRVDGLVDLLDDEELTLPTHARIALAVLVNQLKELDRQVEAIERELAQIQRVNPMAKLLSSIPGIGPITATALAATVPDATMFRSGREFAAWLGLTPKQNPKAGRIGSAGLRNRAIPISGTCLSSEHVTSFGTQRHAPGLEAAGSKPCLNGVDPWSSPSPLPTSWPGSSGR